MLVGAGCADRIDVGFLGYGNYIGRAVAEGKVRVFEWTNGALAFRMLAGARGVPFMPMRNLLGTDTFMRSGAKVVEDPFSGDPVCLVPALNPDVAIVHVQRADDNGNAHLWGIIGEQKEAAFAAKKVILTAEEIVDESVIRSDPNRTMIPGIVVSAVCHVPYACHPSYAQGYYDRDNEFYLAWDKVSELAEATRQYLEEWVYGVKDRDEYWQKLGADKHKHLEVLQNTSHPINYGKY